GFQRRVSGFSGHSHAKRRRCRAAERWQSGQQLASCETEQSMTLHEHVEIDRVEIAPRWIGEAGNVPWRDRFRHPIHKTGPRLPQTPERLARQRLEHRITNAEKAVPRVAVIDD